jgi:hypothetical protein
MKTMSISRQIANMEYGAKLSQLNTEIEEDFKAAGRPEDAAPYVEELAERIKFAKSPQIHWLAKLAKSFGFTMTLGFNPSSALVNMAQVPMVVYLFLEVGTALKPQPKLSPTLHVFIPRADLTVKLKQLCLLVGQKKLKFAPLLL